MKTIRRIQLKELQKNKILQKSNIILASILIIGFILRIYFLGNQSIWIDESFSINAAQNILEKGIPVMDSGINYGRSILHLYITSAFIFFGQNEFWGRLPSVIFGTAMILLAYYLAKKTHSTEAGYYMAFFIALSYWQIAWSRQARMYMQLEFFYWLTIYLAYKKKLIPTAIAGIATILTHKFGLSVLFVAPLIWISEKKKIDSKMIIASIITLPFIANIASSLITGNHYNYLSNYLRFLKNEYILFTLLTIASLIFFNRKKIPFFLITLLPFPIIAILLPVVNLRYIFFLTPALYLGATHYIASLQKTKIGTSLKFIIIIAILIGHQFVFLPRITYALEPGTPQPNFKELYKWINEKYPPEKDIKFTVSETAVHKFYYKKNPEYWIRFSFTGLPDGSWTQNQSKKNEVYTNATIVNDTVKGTIGIYDPWSTTRNGFNANLTDAKRKYGFYIIDKS